MQEVFFERSGIRIRWMQPDYGFKRTISKAQHYPPYREVALTTLMPYPSISLPPILLPDISQQWDMSALNLNVCHIEESRIDPDGKTISVLFTELTLPPGEGGEIVGKVAFADYALGTPEGIRYAIARHEAYIEWAKQDNERLHVLLATLQERETATK